MKINRMAVVQGLNLEPVPGQLRYGCGMTDFEDFYDIAEYVNEKHIWAIRLFLAIMKRGQCIHLLKRKGILPIGGVVMDRRLFYF